MQQSEFRDALRLEYDFLVTSFCLLFIPSTVPAEIAPWGVVRVLDNARYQRGVWVRQPAVGLRLELLDLPSFSSSLFLIEH
jgi:hypothetical protein